MPRIPPRVRTLKSARLILAAENAEGVRKHAEDFRKFLRVKGVTHVSVSHVSTYGVNPNRSSFEPRHGDHYLVLTPTAERVLRAEAGKNGLHVDETGLSRKKARIRLTVGFPYSELPGVPKVHTSGDEQKLNCAQLMKVHARWCKQLGIRLAVPKRKS